MSDDISATVTHRFTIVPFTRYAIKHSSNSKSPNNWSFDGSGQTVCVCATEEEAERIAKLLATNTL